MKSGHYKKVVEDKKRTPFVRCGYTDRFDPFVLNKVPRLRALYGGLFESYLKNIPCETLLDIGCGTGIYFDVLAGYASRIEAIDLSEDMIRVATDYCRASGWTNIHPRVGSAESLDYDNEHFDVVIELDVLHHIDKLDQTLKEVHRVLKPGGFFLAFEPNICNPLMFLAHALPPEERLAIARNRPDKLISLLETMFHTVHWDGVCALITDTAGLRRLCIDAYLNLWRRIGAKRWYPRQVWLGIKPPEGGVRAV